jgi:lysozyme
VTALHVPARGVDVSTWQHPDGKAIDWHEVALAGYSFAIVKATQGTTWVNPWLDRDLDDARAAGLLVGTYHFYELGVNPEAQADHALGMLVGQVLELGFYLDWEVSELQSWQLPESYGVFMAKAMEVRNPVGTYCDQSWYAQLKAGSQPIYRLWLADYNRTEPIPTFLWQNSETGHVAGIPAPVDTNYLLSTRGLNIPSGPTPKPTAATVHSVKATVEEAVTDDDDPAWTALADHTPPPDASRQAPDDEPASE